MIDARLLTSFGFEARMETDEEGRDHPRIAARNWPRLVALADPGPTPPSSAITPPAARRWEKRGRPRTCCGVAASFQELRAVAVALPGRADELEEAFAER